jgi:hypothetical protein
MRAGRQTAREPKGKERNNSLYKGRGHDYGNRQELQYV